MDKEYYKTLLTHEDKLVYMDTVNKSRKAEWDKVNADKVYLYRRSITLRRCIERCSVPTKNTVMKYNFTKEELKPIFDALWTKWTIPHFVKGVSVDDIEDNLMDDT